jgi:hypothetical protein
LYGAHIVGVRYSSIAQVVERYEEFCRFVADFEARHGRDARVRIKKNWLFATRDYQGISYREFTVLSAIFSAIGDKQLVNVTRPRITRCALGYRTAAIMQVEMSRRRDDAVPLTERQLRDTIAALHENKFFARATVARRITYYSIRLGGEELRKAILTKRTHGDFFHASESALDATLTAKIREQRRQVSKAQPKPLPGSSPTHTGIVGNGSRAWLPRSQT